MKFLHPMLLVCVFVTAASAQPVITGENLPPPNSGTVTQTSREALQPNSAPVNAIVAATGGGQTYDFTQVNFAPATTLTYEIKNSVVGTPGQFDPTLSNANYVFIGPHTASWNAYSYFNFNASSGYYFLGSALVYDSDANGVIDTAWTTFDPPQSFYVLPLTSTSVWDQSLTTTTRSVFGTSSSTRDLHGEVEGWGSLMLPGGITLDALRVRRTFTQDVGGGVMFTISILDFVTNDRYQATITFDGTGAPQSANYGSFEQGGGGVGREEVTAVDFRLLPAYPNPVRETAVLPIEVDAPGALRISVVDMLGREVLRPVDEFVAAGRYDVRVDVRGLPSGFYLYKVSSGSGARTGQMVVRR